LLSEKCRRGEVELVREQQLTYDAQSAARVATQAADSLRAELTAVKQSRDQLDVNLTAARQLLRERTDSRLQCFEQSLAVEVSGAVSG